jgi:hypothetical protein
VKATGFYQYRPKDSNIVKIRIRRVEYARNKEGIFEIPADAKRFADENPNLVKAYEEESEED